MQEAVAERQLGERKEMDCNWWIGSTENGSLSFLPAESHSLAPVGTQNPEDGRIISLVLFRGMCNEFTHIQIIIII